MATTAFGLESAAAFELKKLGFENIHTENGHVMYEADEKGITLSNLWLRTAERVFLVVAQFKSDKFETLFDQIKAIPWEEYLPEDAEFPVDAKSVKSTLYSLSDIQRISKKAIVNRLGETYNLEWFEETGAKFPIQVSILKDVVTVAIDTSGSGLHRRGYRERAGDAPIKETLAAGLIQLSKWKSEMPLVDPFCGSGTILIEAAMIARNIAPGLSRHFVFETWPWIDEELCKTAKKEAYAQIKQEIFVDIKGFDSDAQAIELAYDNAEIAGVEDIISFEVRDIKEFSVENDRGYIICNPPYGERMNEIEQVKEISKTMGQVFKPYTGWSKYIITSYEQFETLYGNPSDKNRKLYNGRIKTYYYQYFGKKSVKDSKFHE